MGLVRRRGNREGRRGWRWRRAGAGESSGVAHPLLVVVAYICWAMTPRGPP